MLTPPLMMRVMRSFLVSLSPMKVSSGPRWAAEVRAVDRKRDELVLARAPQPDRAPGADARPGQRGGVGDGDVDRFAEDEILDLADVHPLLGRLAEQRRDDEADHGHREDGPANRAEADAELFQEPAAVDGRGVGDVRGLGGRRGARNGGVHDEFRKSNPRARR